MQKASNFKHATTLRAGSSSSLSHAETFKHLFDHSFRGVLTGSGRTGRPVRRPHRRKRHPAQSRLRQHPVHRPQRPAHAVRRKLTLAGQTGGMGVDLAGTQQAGHRSGDHLAALLLLTAHRQHHGKAGCYQLCVKLPWFILFVDKCNGWTACATLCKLQIFRVGGSEPSNTAKISLPPPAFSSCGGCLGFNGIFGLAQTGGIEQIQLDIPSCTACSTTHGWCQPPA